MSLRCLSLAILLLAPPLSLADPPAARLDAHGFPLPEGAIARLGDLHFAQPEAVTALALSPDGKVIASAGRRIYLWNAETRRIVRELAASGRVDRLIFSSDGRLLAAGTNEGELGVWDVASGKAKWTGRGKLSEGTSVLTSLRFIDKNRLVAIARIDREWPSSTGECLVQVWDSEQGVLKRSWAMDTAKKEKLKSLSGGHGFSWVVLSPSGEQMAWLASPHETVKGGRCAVLLYDTASGRLLREVKGLRAPAERMSLLDEGETLLLQSGQTFGSQGMIVQMGDGRKCFSVDYRVARFISRPVGEQLYVDVLGTSVDGKSLYTQDEVGMLRWDLASGKASKTWCERCTALSFSADGKRAVLARGARLHLCDEDFKPVRTGQDFSEPPYVGYLSNSQMALDSLRERRRKVVNVRQGDVLENVRRHESPAIAKTPCSFDGAHKLFAHHDENENGLVVHDLIADRRICQLEGVKVQDAWSVWPFLSGDGSRVFVSSYEKDALSCAGSKAGTAGRLAGIVFPTRYDCRNASR